MDNLQNPVNNMQQQSSKTATRTLSPAVTVNSDQNNTHTISAMPVILVVDDERHICNIVEEYFTILGYRVSKAFNGVSGMKRFKDDCPTIVITDMNITDCTGFDIARQVKAASPETTLILITGYPVDSLEMGEIAGNIDYILQKPIDFAALAGIVSSIAGQTKATEQFL